MAAPEAKRLAAICALYKDRCSTTVELADWAAVHAVAPVHAEVDLTTHVTEAIRPALRSLRGRLAEAEWSKEGVAQALKATLAEYQLKMPQLAIPLRVLLTGRTQTPSVDAVVALITREDVLTRLRDV